MKTWIVRLTREVTQGTESCDLQIVAKSAQDAEQIAIERDLENSCPPFKRDEGNSMPGDAYVTSCKERT